MNNRKNSNKQPKPEMIELLVHLSNGDILHVKESVGKPDEETLIYDFANEASGSHFYEFGNEEEGIHYVPRANIVYISTVPQKNESDTTTN